MRRLSLPRLVMVAMAAPLLLGGCQPLLGRTSSSAAQPQVTPAPAASPLVAFVAAAQPGQRATLSDPAVGTVVVTFEREYTAASNQTCRRFNLRPATGGAPESLVMCQEPAGWSVVRLPAIH